MTDPAVAFFSAETKLIKALSIVPDHPQGHMTLGFVYMSTKRATRGIAECEHALALDRNLASAHAFIGMGKVLIGRAEETEAITQPLFFKRAFAVRTVIKPGRGRSRRRGSRP